MPRTKKLVAVALVIFVALFVALSYLDAYLAGVLKQTAERETFARSGVQLDLGVVEVSLLRGDLVALGPRLIDPARAETIALAQRLAVDASPWSLAGNMVTINSINLWKLETTIDIDAQGLPKMPKSPAYPTPSPQLPGLRIDKIDVYAEEIVVRHELPQGGRVDWKIHPATAATKGIRLPSAPGSEIPLDFSAQLLEPTTGTVEAKFVFTPTEDGWGFSGRKDVQIAQAAALSPYLPPDFPLVPSSGSLTLRNDVTLHGTILDSTVTIALSRPRFEPRERTLSSMFTGQMSQFAIRAIRDATGDINLDPIHISGDLSDPEMDLRGPFLTDLRRQILSRIFQRATSIPSDIARQLQNAILSLPPAAVLDRAGVMAGKVLEAGAGLADKGMKVGQTATDAAKNVGSRIKRLIRRRE
jgi:hypothetical protein